MMDNIQLREVRCKGCGRLLGQFRGKGEVKCPKTECGGMNIFDLDAGRHDFKPKIRKPSYLKSRTTSSGVTFR